MITQENTIKAIITMTIAAINVYVSNIVVPLSILIITMILDYATGMTNAWLKRELSSQKGIQGIVKKVGYLVVIAVAMVADYLIISVLSQVGIESPIEVTVIALLVTVWLILNECISILENLDSIGTPMPAFLKKLIERLKNSTEEKGEGSLE